MKSKVYPPGRSVHFEAGYDKRAEPGDYGCHGMGIRFIVKGEEGAVQFVMNTGWVPWQPAPVENGGFGPSYDVHEKKNFSLYAVDLGFHALAPRYYQHAEDGRTDCMVLDGQTCYYDGSSLNADPILVTLIYEGEEAMWKRLEDYYRSIFLAPEGAGS